MLHRLSLSIPQYEAALKTFKIGELLHSPTPRLMESFARFYADLFEFFQAVLEVFVKPNGRTLNLLP
jgi:hypothetical protein